MSFQDPPVPTRQDPPPPGDPTVNPTPVADPDDVAGWLERRSTSTRFAFDTLFDSAARPEFLPFAQMDAERRFDAHRARMFGARYGNELTAEEANARFGVDGYLSFDGPINAREAEWRHDRAVRRRYEDDVVGRSDLGPLGAIGASVSGSLANPENLPFWFLGGEGALLRGLKGGTMLAGRPILRGAVTGGVDGVIAGSALEAGHVGLALRAEEDVDYGDALTSILLGQVLGATAGATGGALRGRERGPATTRPGGGESVSFDTWSATIQRQETGDNPRRISRDPDGDGPAGGGAVGAMQLLPDTGRAMARRLGIPFDADRLLNDVEYNRRLGNEYLKFLSERYDGDMVLATTAYHAGEGNVDRWLRRHGDPRSGQITYDAWLKRVEASGNPRSARYPREVFEKLGRGIDGGAWAEGIAATDWTPPTRPAPLLTQLTPDERRGAFAEAAEATFRDEPVDLGPMLERPGLSALDEATAEPSLPGRYLQTTTAITRRGDEIPVRFALVELDDLLTSHTDDLTEVADYPAALQPRDRTRPGPVAENYELEATLNPGLLMFDRAASAGAPIVSPDGVVESGNGRIIALRRSANTGTPAWTRYVEHLPSEGLDPAGMRRPVLVRVRAEAMTGERRAALAGQMNQSQTEAYSPVEQARADAKRLDADALGQIQGADPFSAASRPFVRAFLARTPGDKGALTNAEGALTPQGEARVRAALVQTAYGDADLTALLFETADGDMKAVGQALADAAPEWARMRATADPALDITGALTSAVHLLRHARASREPTDQALKRLIGNAGLFEGTAVSPETEALLRLMFRDDDLTRPRGADRLAWALQAYARDAANASVADDLFGDVPDARARIESLKARLEGAEGEGSRGLSYAGGSEPRWTLREAEPAGGGLFETGGDGDGPGRGGGRPQGGGEAEGQGGGVTADRSAAPTKDAAEVGRPGEDAARRLIDADPEIKAVLADTEALARAAGVDVPDFLPNERPAAIAEAYRAAAICLATETGAGG